MTTKPGTRMITIRLSDEQYKQVVLESEQFKCSLNHICLHRILEPTKIPPQKSRRGRKPSIVKARP